MAEHQTEDRSGHLRTTITLKPGERIVLCRCMKSGDFPFCDGTHKEQSGNAGPIVVTAPSTNEEKS